jgi:glycine cleavage system H lipoate-binding protein
MAMRCPFLREEQVKSCRAAPYRKPLARSALKGADERCTSPEHVRCPMARQSREAHPAPSRCPFLQESLVQFCAAAPVPTYVPWSESPDVRCCHDGHRFCDLYLGMAGPGGRGPAVARDDSSDTGIVDVEGVPMPGWLLYAPNHLWVDFGDDGFVHMGVDAFLTRLVGAVERLAFLTLKGSARPMVVLTVQGVDLTLAFGRPLPIVAANTHLRSHLDRLVQDPYGLGWLFEARVAEPRPAAEASDSLVSGLYRGAAARAWMSGEVRRLTELVHDRLAPRTSLGTLLADGGAPEPGLVGHLDREDVLRLFADLFPPSVEAWRLS